MLSHWKKEQKQQEHFDDIEANSTDRSSNRSAVPYTHESYQHDVADASLDQVTEGTLQYFILCSCTQVN